MKAATSLEKKTSLPTKNPKTQPQKGLHWSVRKLLMAAPYAYSAGKRSMSEKFDREQKRAEKEKKTISGGGRAKRSKVVHETPQMRGGKRRQTK